jgi:cytidylate kinase
MKPIIIYVSGAPGSGKTTLAKLLSEQLYIQQISSDLIHGGVGFTHPGHDRKLAIESVFVPLMIDMAQKGISFVVDHVLQKDIASTTIIDRLSPYATIIYVHVQSTNPIERYISRIKSSDLPDIRRRRELLLERAVHHQENLSNTAAVLDLHVPTILVDTNDGYDPDLGDILKFIHKCKIPMTANVTDEQ